MEEENTSFSSQKSMNTKQTQCRRCGTCCLSGGPALHAGDLPLVENGVIARDRLITIRRGELVDHPLTGRLQSVAYEVVKITGTGREWCCVFYSGRRGCTIHPRRPSACRALKCWDTTEIAALVGRDTLTRLDILKAGDPLRPLVQEHERLCPCPDMEQVRSSVLDGTLADLPALQILVADDLRFRGRVVREMQLSLAEEMFAFGRPLFQLLQAVGIEATEKAGEIHLALS